MTTCTKRLRQLLLIGCFALAATAAPTLGAFAAPQPTEAPPAALCPPGEEMDIFTTNCVPHTVPNSSRGFTAIPGNPDVPAIDGIPCTPGNLGQCIGLAEEQQQAGPHPVPRSTSVAARSSV